MKNLPIGIQTLSKIIENDFVYVDKTHIAYTVIKSPGYYFLSRPRRFGKSLFLDTLKEIFEGNKDLFKGLYIYDNWDWEDKYPVLRISLGSGVMNDIESLPSRLRWILERTENDLEVKCDAEDPVKCFQELLLKSYDKYGKKVVVLIDEYDKPILDNITDSEVARAMRDYMKDFYSVIKDNDASIRTVFIAGVSKFSKMNLFSGLNNLEDITLNAQFGNICGYTHNDLLTVFEQHLVGVDMEEVKRWYNGYNYFGEKVYNPFDILLFISNQFEFNNYWWSTGNPSFLIDVLKTGNYFLPDLENFTATTEILNTFDVDRIELAALLWQTGYLTIKEKTNTFLGVEYKLGVPNKEIQLSLNSLFITYLTGFVTEKHTQRKELFRFLVEGDPEGFKNILYRLLASIPYSYYTKNRFDEKEGYYASLVYVYLASLGVEIINEDITNRGRIDITVKLFDKVYILELKVVSKPTGTALKQIKEKRYYEKYQNFKDIYLVGIEFGSKERNIVGFEWEKLPNAKQQA